MQLAAEIRAELARQRLSYADLANRLGVTRQTISQKLGTEKSDITMKDLQQIAKELNVSPAVLIQRAERSCSERREVSA